MGSLSGRVLPLWLFLAWAVHAVESFDDGGGQTVCFQRKMTGRRIRRGQVNREPTQSGSQLKHLDDVEGHVFISWLHEGRPEKLSGGKEEFLRERPFQVPKLLNARVQIV